MMVLVRDDHKDQSPPAGPKLTKDDGRVRVLRYAFDTPPKDMLFARWT
jgi:hypothetical protein